MAVSFPCSYFYTPEKRENSIRLIGRPRTFPGFQEMRALRNFILISV